MKKGMVIVSTAIIAAAVCQAQWTGQLLNSSAVTNEYGQIVVLHDGGGCYNVNNNTPNDTADKVFDGSTGTYYNSAADQGAWVGFELQSPKLVTRIRYYGRNGYGARARGVLVQGASQSDFSDAVTLWALSPPADWNGNSWVDELLLSPAAATNTFTYVRVYSPLPLSYGGNFTELQFYGADPLGVEVPPPDTPAVTYATCINWRMNLYWASAPSSAVLYELQRKIAQEADFSPLMCAYATSGELTHLDMTLMLYADTEYRLRALSNAGASAWTNITGIARNSASSRLIGSPGSWENNGNTGAKAFDGNMKTAINGNLGTGFWTGMDFGTEREITHVNFLPRTGFRDRMNGGTFESADNADFVNATVFYNISFNPPDNAVTEVMLSPPVTTRYARYYPPPGRDTWGDAAELEFLLSPTPPHPPNGLSIVSSDITNAFAVLTWRLYDVGSLISSVMVYRAVSPGGPYTCITPGGLDLSGMTWTDTSVVAGIPYYYMLTSLFCDGTVTLEGEPSAHVPYIACERLERYWHDNTQIKYAEGMDLIGKHYITHQISNPTYYLERMFDGNLGTFPDTSADPGGKNPAVGVDLGKPCSIQFVRFAPRHDFLGRLNGAELRGSNNPEYTNEFTRLATFTGAVSWQLTTQQTVTREAFRYIFVQRPDANEFFGNVAELELYGWDDAVFNSVLTAPDPISLSHRPDGIRLDWKDSGTRDFYRIERSADGGASWDILDEVPGTPFTDTDIIPVIGQRVLYRVLAVQATTPDETIAYSAIYDIIPYFSGSGTGLNAYYYTNYFPSYNPSEGLTATRLEDAPDFAPANNGTAIRTDIPGTVENVRIAWHGNLTVPFTGDWTIYVTSDDGVALRIDDAFVINSWYTRGATTDQVTLHLTEGPHPIRIDYFQGGGGKAMKLEWASATISRAVIPTLQLEPLPLPADEDVFLKTGEWSGRTFGTGRLGHHTMDGNGDITLHSAGGDMSGANENFYYAWQNVSGDFIFEAKAEMDIDPDRRDGKAMLMVRDSLAAGSPLLAACAISAHASGRFTVKHRIPPETTISDLSDWDGPSANPFYLRVKRSKDVFTLAYRDAAPGSPWVQMHEFTDAGNAFSNDIYIGMAVCAPVGSSQKMFQTATFSDISIRKVTGTILMIK